jgi:hypothetical protein
MQISRSVMHWEYSTTVNSATQQKLGVTYA